MSDALHEREDAAPALREQPDAGRRPNLLRRVLGAVFAIGLAGVVALAVGFFWFVTHVAIEEKELTRHSDAIVVLTGGASRIADAVDLLATGKGGRLLITGVHRDTTAREIARIMPAHRKWFACCIDLGYSAVNTVGNAVETRGWAQERGFRSLIVVTSSYHMPRAMVELGRHLPDVALIAYPVVSERIKSEPWWHNTATAKLLASEYVKYLVAVARMRWEDDIVTGSTRAARDPS